MASDTGKEGAIGIVNIDLRFELLHNAINEEAVVVARCPVTATTKVLCLSSENVLGEGKFYNLELRRFRHLTRTHTLHTGRVWDAGGVVPRGACNDHYQHRCFRGQKAGSEPRLVQLTAQRV